MAKDRILIVDDEAGVRSSLQGILEDEGYKVDSVSSAETALARLGATSYDLEPAADWSDISSDPLIQADLEAAYCHIDLVDPWVGGLAEDRLDGGIMGELALIDSKPRSASAVAKTDCRLVPLDDKQFIFLVQQTPFFAIRVMRIMAERLRRETQSHS